MAVARHSRFLTCALAALLVNSAYLAARADASLFYYSNVALHAIGGIGIALLALYSLSRVPQRAGVIVLLAAAAAGDETAPSESPDEIDPR